MEYLEATKKISILHQTKKFKSSRFNSMIAFLSVIASRKISPRKGLNWSSIFRNNAGNSAKPSKNSEKRTKPTMKNGPTKSIRCEQKKTTP